MNKANDPKVAAAIAEERRRNKEAIERKDVGIVCQGEEDGVKCHIELIARSRLT
jgi:hypothetical protein